MPEEKSASLATPTEAARPSRSPIAIVGMSCLFPMAKDVASFWKNIVEGRDCLRDASPLEWEPARYQRPLGHEFKHIYCVRGGFVSELADFDPLKFGVMPKSVSGADPDQFLALKVASEAMVDAGYSKFPANLERAEVILGRTSAPGQGSMNMIQHGQTIDQMLAVIHQLHPELSADEISEIARYLHGSINPANSDTVPGVMPNILAGRIASRLGLMGRNMLLDAACASSLIAVETAVADLRSGMCDLALAGGIHINSFACFYQMFCALTALSPSQKIRPFDEAADGTLLGEGLGIVVLKRLSDAIENGDRIYAVLRGIGSSSDGHGTSMLAPSFEGESLAMRRALVDAGVSPLTIGLIEAHGTGTAAGDVAELKSIEQVYAARETDEGNASGWAALGSVKSMIGHCQAASGIAGLIKAALSLYHRVLPPTLNVSRPNSQIDWNKHPCYLINRASPWMHPSVHASVPEEERHHIKNTVEPRRAAVSAFGFGGVNAHAILEEYIDEEEATRPTQLREWESEIFLISSDSVKALIEECKILENFISRRPDASLRDVAYTLYRRSTRGEKKGVRRLKLAIVAGTNDELLQALQRARQKLQSGTATGYTDDSCFISGDAETSSGKLAFVLPGLGAAFPNMLSELCLHFPDVRAVFDYVDQLSLSIKHSELSNKTLAEIDAILPTRKIFNGNGKRGPAGSAALLASMDSAVVTVILAEYALYKLLDRLGVKPDAVVGVSTGEFAALTITGASNVLEAAPIFFKLSTAVAQAVAPDELAKLRTIKVSAPYEKLEPILKGLAEPVYLSADLSPTQVLLSATRRSMDAAQAAIKSAGFEYYPLPLAIPYHTPLVEGKVNSNDSEVRQVPLKPSEIPSWGCSIADTYPGDPEEMKKLTTSLFTRPIHFRKTIDAMYASGVRKFVEVGPKGGLTPIVEEILSGRPGLAVAANLAGGSEIAQLLRMLAVLAVNDVPVNLDYIFERRCAQELLLEHPEKGGRSPSEMRLSLKYPEVSLFELPPLPSLKKSEFSQPFSNEITADWNEPDEYYAADQSTPSDATDEVMSGYLGSLSVFHQNLMSMQSRVVSDLFGQQTGTGQSMMHTKRAPAFIASGFANRISDRKMEIIIPITPETHPYLLDHAIGGVVSIGGGAERIHLVPLTVALEMMSQCASLLFPQDAPVRLSEIRALKRIRVGNQGLMLKVVAEADGREGKSAKVDIFVSHYGPDSAPSFGDEACMSCCVTFDTSYPAQPDAPPPLTGRAARLKGVELYQKHTMFHGPRMQSVQSVDAVAEREISGTILNRQARDFLRIQDAIDPFTGAPSFLIDPLMLDNSTQLVLFHLFEHEENVSALLPFHVESLELFAPALPDDGTLTVRAQLKSISARGTVADVTIITPQGKVLARFTDISSKRISLDDQWKRLIHAPHEGSLGVEVKEATDALADSDRFECIEVIDKVLPDDEATLFWLMDYVLTCKEQAIVNSFSDRRRRREWLAGRIAAKECVKRLVKRHFATDLCYADINISSEPDGRPAVELPWRNERAPRFSISITHKDGVAMALVSLNTNKSYLVGIDLEPIKARDPSFERLVLSGGEPELLAGLAGAERDEALTILWTTKEAGGKARGTGLSGNPRSIETKDINFQAGTATIYGGTAGSGSLPIRSFKRNGNIIAVAAVALSETAV